MKMLKKMSMPKPKELDTSELDMPESTEEEAAESPEMEESEDEAMEKHTGPELKSVTDEDLLAEVKKRGLMAQLETETGEESAEDAYI